MLILFLFLLFLVGLGHAFIDSALSVRSPKMTLRWINACLSGVSYLVIFYLATFFL
jgi:hypothetical protein